MPSNPTPPFGWDDNKPDAELHTLQFGNGEYGSSCFSVGTGPDPSTWVDVDDTGDPSQPDD
jgi:hypothetical protein